MSKEPLTVGIDIGSTAIGLIVLDKEFGLCHSDYRCHHGHVDETLLAMFEELNISSIGHVAATSSSPAHVKAQVRYDSRIAVIKAARYYYPSLGAIILVGGEKFFLLRFDESGNYIGHKANTSCAAGTGSFLDQQAQRLNLKDIEALAECAVGHRGPSPKIASRCAVFAKTDLIHAQQEGFDLSAICDGLCFGLAENIYDTLFAGESVTGPIIMCGGVSRNQAVVQYLSSLIDAPLIVHDQAHLFGAIGAALNLMAEVKKPSVWKPASIYDLLATGIAPRRYSFAPLALTQSDYPDFRPNHAYHFSAPSQNVDNPVEVDIYSDLKSQTAYPAYLGVDIGSTSTKAVLLATDHNVMAGFYTRTAGRPLTAMQSILAAIEDLKDHRQIKIRVMGCGTTGSGRKFIGRILGADLVVDEISAHARAAYALNPEVDTIIEIGGQDSKFTTLENGSVTSAVMNTICAAGTGSFIEEQAQRLHCPLSDFTDRTLNRPSPMASDRCTVFMERDLHHYLSEGYTVDEVLSAVLHAVCENYLTKVAVEARIGRTILFQGATAKNKALVAAFEQRLKRPIHVSRYCHLTGAMGVALMLAEQGVPETAFRGTGLGHKNIPLQYETCDLCTNHCKITLAFIEDRKVAYGFLCDRDYDTQHAVHHNPSGYNLLKEHKKAFKWQPEAIPEDNSPIIGIPAALHLHEDLPLWQFFFNRLGFNVVTSQSFSRGVSEGRHIAGAHFCAPMTALHGHVKHLRDRCDYIFLPHYLENRSRDRAVRRQYCYYTQFSVPLVSAVETGQRCKGYLTPLVHYLYNSLHTKYELHKVLKSIRPAGITFSTVAAAYDQALQFKDEGLIKLRAQYQRITSRSDDVFVVLLGRPYTVLSPAMNKGIPDILASLGIKAFYQDMLKIDEEDELTIATVLKEFHWYHAVSILAGAEEIARTPGAYPVLITSFKCSPDAFVIDYFRQTMAAYGKPYLVLQVDDHDATGGYETRIEAAVRTFRNHRNSAGTKYRRPPTPSAIVSIPSRGKPPLGKTLLLPNWDDLTLPLIAAALRREGIDARVLQHSSASYQKGLRYNTGQCIPLNIIAQEFVDYIESAALDPAETMLWMPIANIACNIHLYPAYIQQFIKTRGGSMSEASVYIGPMSMSDLSLKMPLRGYFAYMFGGYLRRMGCRIRPYEKTPGNTNAALRQGLTLLVEAFEGRWSYEQALDKVITLLESVDVSKDTGLRSKVAIFGDLYARDNSAINQNLIPFIEANGGEVLTTPYTDYLKMIAKSYLRKWIIEGHYLEAFSSKLILTGLKRRESFYYTYFQRILKEPERSYDDPPSMILERYRLRPENTGESMDNLLKVHYLLKHHPEITLMVQTSPAFCCPALITEAMARRIEQNTGIPIVSITYDGTGGNKNEVIIPYLSYPRTDPVKSSTNVATKR